MMKICLLLSTFAYDGIKRSVVHYANAMQELGHEVWVGVLHDWPGKVSLRSELKIPNSQVVSWDGLGQGRREWAMYRFFKKQKFDVVHCNTVKMNHLGRWIGWLARVPCLIASEDNLCLKRSALTRCEDRLLAQLSDCVVMISEAVAQSFLEVEKLPPSKVKVIYYGLPMETFNTYMKSTEELARKRAELGIPPGPMVLCAARLHFSKSLCDFVRAARVAVDQIPNIQFVLAGDGDEKENLEGLKKQLRLEGNLHLLGARMDIYDLMQMADVVTLCSLWEGLGFSLMEAMAFKKPIVGTNVSGINEIIEHQFNGFLVPAHNGPCLAGAILKVVTQREISDKMIRNGQQVLQQKFDIQKNTRQLVELYQACLSRKRPATSPAPIQNKQS